MIKFFRTLRNEQIKQSRPFKCLLYAIGEIILVMIGILLAFQVSNWKENNANRVKELKILKQLNVDLKKNLVELKDLSDFLRENNQAGLKILNHLETQENVSDSLKLWVQFYDDVIIFNNAMMTYKNIENSESNIITNDSIRIAITTLYEEDFTNVHQRERTFRENELKYYIQQVLDNFNAGPIMAKSVMNLQFDTNLPKNYTELRQNEDYKAALVRVFNYNDMRIFHLGNTLIKIEKVIQDIEEEIKRLE